MSFPNGLQARPIEDIGAEIANLRVAVTGAQGFLGSHLVARLTTMGISPVILSGDVRRKNTFEATFDLLFHLAGAVPADFRRRKDEARSSNLEGASNAVAACLRRNARLVFISTSGVYRHPSDSPLRETDPLEPVSEYAETKLLGEQMCREAAAEMKNGVTVIRLFNPYGLGQSTDLLIGYVLDNLRANRPVEIQTPDAERDFVHIFDVVEALLLSARPVPGIQVYNIGSGQAHSIREVVNLIGERLNGLGNLNYLTNRDPLGKIVADITLARRELGWSPKVEITDGLDEAIGLNTSFR
jgi:UDP-glucose 4-epimerase